MQIKYNKSIKNRIILIELETANFTKREVDALNKFGEPVINVEKVYNKDFPVSINKKIRSGFKVRVKFDGTEDIERAADAASQFFEEIEEILEEEIEKVTEMADDLESDFETDSGYITVTTR